MGLEHERVDPIIIKKTGKHKWRPCGGYVDQSGHPSPYGFTSWPAWLQKLRIELDAMTGPQLAAWFDRKLLDAPGKVIPPGDHMRTRLLEQIERQAKKDIEEKILLRAEAKIKKRVDAIMVQAHSNVPDANEMQLIVAEKLKQRPVEWWRSIVDDLRHGYLDEHP